MHAWCACRTGHVLLLWPALSARCTASDACLLMQGPHALATCALDIVPCAQTGGKAGEDWQRSCLEAISHGMATPELLPALPPAEIWQRTGCPGRCRRASSSRSSRTSMRRATPASTARCPCHQTARPAGAPTPRAPSRRQSLQSWTCHGLSCLARSRPPGCPPLFWQDSTLPTSAPPTSAARCQRRGFHGSRARD